MRYIRGYHHILGVSENNANIQYIGKKAIIGYINNKNKYKVHQDLYIILIHHKKDKYMVHYKYIQINGTSKTLQNRSVSQNTN